MANTDKDKLVGETATSLKRIQEFDPQTIARVEDLGKDLNFLAGVPAANRLVRLFQQVALDVLDEFPVPRLNTIYSSPMQCLTCLDKS